MSTEQQQTLGFSAEEEKTGPVECLGQAFESDDARREHYLGLLAEKLKDPEFRKTPGFPIGEDEDILQLSDPPYYTACPNPFLPQIVEHNVSAPNEYVKKPFAADVSEGKTDQVYKAHTYHTKVPHKAIMRYILHYTKPGDIVFDGFCGTGMTGVAAQQCGQPTPDFRKIVEASADDDVEWGPRLAVLNELSPFASFIAANYTRLTNADEFEAASRYLLEELAQRLGKAYQTQHSDGRKGHIQFVVWSELFFCQNCGHEMVFSKEALDRSTKKMSRDFKCPTCSADVSKRSMSRSFETFFDPINQMTAKRVKREPILIFYTVADSKYEKIPDDADLRILQELDSKAPKSFFPSVELPYMHISHIKDKMSNFGISHLSHFFLPRAQHALADLWDIARSHPHKRMRDALLFAVEQCNWAMSLFNRYRPTGYSQVNQYMSGVFYIPSQSAEISPWYMLEGKLSRLSKVFASIQSRSSVAITTGSGSSLTLPDNSIDYIFTDPPFGENLQYSELNWIVECFHKVTTSSDAEAVVNKAQRKETLEYLDLMLSCFRENYRVLKPGRWMTVEFHNSNNSIWNAIQEAMLRAGFVVADVRMLDKQGETYKQSKQGVVKADLIISAYKPPKSMEETFNLTAGTDAGVWEFVDKHLSQLPVFVTTRGKSEIITERQQYLLFDRMVAFHVQREVKVPMSAAEFYAGLAEKYPVRDGMHLLHDQVSEYDRKRAKTTKVRQLTLFVSDEASATQWIREQLRTKPQSFQDLQPLYMPQTQAWAKHEDTIDLQEILELNFLCYDGNGPVPSQIHSYLSTNFKDLRKLEKDDAALKDKAVDRWYVPDPGKEGDLEKLRLRTLLKEFEEYRTGAAKKIKQFRSEAVRAGFKHCYDEQDYQAIVDVAAKLPEKVIQEDEKLLMYYDVASMRLGG